MSAFLRFISLPKQDKKFFLVATFYCVTFKIMILIFPLKKYARILGLQNIYVNHEPSEKQLQVIYKISRAIVRSRRVIPWKSQCLTEAITAKVMLRGEKIKSTLYLGINKKNGDMTAHAWLKCGGTWVTGRKGSDQFTIISTFN